MRNILTFVAVALVTALMVALVAPPFIDWSARREMVARSIAARIGTPVEISGPVTLRLLPTPYLKLANVAVGPRGAPWLKGPAMRLEFSFASLFTGKIRIEDVVFDHPSVSLGPRFAAPEEGRLQFDHIRAVHAQIRIARSGAAPIVLDDLNFDGSAHSARGPWRGGGDFAFGAARANYQFVADAFTADALPLKAEVDAGGARADFDGRLMLGPAPALAGATTITGEANAPDGGVWPWRIAGVVAASGDEARIAKAEVRLGDEARALEGVGEVSLRFGERPTLAADLTAKTLNIDALLRKDKQTFAPPERALEAFAAVAARALGRDAPLAKFALHLKSDAAYLGARSLEAPELTLSGAPDGAMRLKLASGVPGHGRVALDGALELKPAPIFRGRAEGEVGDFASLAAWIGEGEPAFAERLATLGAAMPQGAVSASGDVEVSPEGYSVRGLTLGVGPSRFDGAVVYRLPSPERRGRLYLDLASDALDIEEAPNVEDGLAWLGDTDLDFRFQANKLRVARVGLASVQSGSLTVRAVKEGAKFALNQLSLANLGGASIEAQGETSPSGRWTRVKLEAGHLNDLTALLARAAPGPLTGWLQQRADDLGAASLTFEARRDGPPLKGPFALDFVKGDGSIAGARVTLTLSRAPAPVDAISVQASLDSPDAGALLRKLGAKISAGPPGRAELSLSGTGQLERGFEGKAQLAFAGADLTWSGALHPQAPDAWISGPLTVKSADLIPALAALGLATPGTGATAPADLSADLAAGPDGAHLTRLAGSLAGSRLGGELTWTRRLTAEDPLAPPLETVSADPPPPAISGELDLDHASLGALLSLVLGRPAPTRIGALWPEAKFGPALVAPPSLDVALKVGALDLGLGVGRAMTSRLKLDHYRLALDDASLLLNGGKASGRLDLRRDKAQATATGALSLQGVALDRGGLSGRFDASIDFVGAGETAATLVGGLAGAGRLKIAEAKIPRLDRDALGRAFDKIEQAAGMPPEAKKLQSLLAAELDKAPLSLAGAEGGLSFNSGALRFGPVDAPAREGSAAVSGVLNLADLSLSLDTKETYEKVGRFWSGPPPTVEIAQKGADASGRRIDVAFLSAGLSAEAIARESDRIENFEADVRERAMFNRRRKAEEFMARRQREIAEFLADQQRRRLMQRYLGPYTQWADSHREPPPLPPTRSESPAGRKTARDASGL